MRFLRLISTKMRRFYRAFKKSLKVKISNRLVSKRLLIVLTIFQLMTVPVFSTLPDQVDAVPNPMETSGLYVQDSAGVLGPEYIQLINSVCEVFYEKTSADLAVVTIASLEGIPIEDFAFKLFERFGIGERGRDTGILILFSLNDREIRIEVGYGLEAVVTDADAGHLLDEHAIPFFKEGEYGRGLYTTTLKTAELIAGIWTVPLDIEEPETLPPQAPPPTNKQTPQRRENPQKKRTSQAFLAMSNFWR